MNWSLILWFAGILATIYGLKFVMELFKSLLGKDARKGLMESIGNGINSTSEKMSNSLKEKVAQRKREKEEMKNRPPIVMIRR